MLASFSGLIETLWTTLVPGGVPETPQRILFSSPSPGEGTTTAALCAAIGLATHLRQKVTLVEANYHSPALAAYLDLPATPGLLEAVGGSAPIESALHQTFVPGLLTMPAGRDPDPLPGLLGSVEVRDVLDQLTVRSQFVLIDSPPLLTYPEARHLIWNAHAVVGVFCTGRTSREHANRWVETVRTAGTKFLGVTLNRYRPELPRWLRDRV